MARESQKVKPYQGYKIIGIEENVNIGESVSFGGNVILFANHNISIGAHTMVGINTLLHTSTHNYNLHPMWMERHDRPIKIGKHVWIGANVIISPGVIVEDFAVIGAGSVVIDNVPKYAIVGGNPARILKYRSEVDINIPVPIYPEGASIKKDEYKTKYCKKYENSDYKNEKFN